MSAAGRANKAQALINEVARIPPPSYSNYKHVMDEYRRVLTDLLVLIRDDAAAEDLSLSSINPYKPET